MDTDFYYDQIVREMRIGGKSATGAARYLAQGFRQPFEKFAPALERLRQDAERNSLLDGPTGVVDDFTRDEARGAAWYTGPSSEIDVCWPSLRTRFEVGGMRDAVEDIDEASTKVVAQLTDPTLRGVKKRGLVLGYVQSGKTANFTSVIAKAADAGYSLFIVLSGLHNNLRQQTQVRLDTDLIDDKWHPLTNATADFANQASGAAMLSKDVKTLGVVKKNQSRLRNLRDWLRDIPLEIRRKVPVLLLDDEADQATPNSATSSDDRSRINELIRQIWCEIPTGTYLGYTATPFANVFMDPADEEELYPADFIINLPRPDSYFGAERIFGREPLDDGDDPDPGLDMIRDIPNEDAELLKPPGSRDEREDFRPELPSSLEDAIRWFVVATAVRKARGQVDNHSSMLIHTTHYVHPHFAIRDKVEDLLQAFAREVSSVDTSEFEASFCEEKDRAAEAATLPMPPWGRVAPWLGPVLDDLRVVVDNGYSDDRLDYNRRGADGRPLPETVIAVGGGTLSRGLTLEGLLVSYFTRTSNTYDTLLQMGRWFGFRPGYEDLTRMWLQPSLQQDFRFLALVEEDIRRDIEGMANLHRTPRQLGVRVRTHPGRLEIVARNKMRHAQKISVSFSGKRLQTTQFVENDVSMLRANLDSAREFIGAAVPGHPVRRIEDRERWVLSDVPSRLVEGFLEAYRFHPQDESLGRMAEWIRKAMPKGLWNVVVAGRSDRSARSQSVDASTVDLGVCAPVHVANRAPLKFPDDGSANIKALLSAADWFADLDPAQVGPLKEANKDPRAVRARLADGRGLIILMPVAKESVPMKAASLNARRAMHAPEHLLGVGVIFPELREGSRESGEFVSVLPDWAPESEDEDNPPADSEGDFVGGQS